MMGNLMGAADRAAGSISRAVPSSPAPPLASDEPIPIFPATPETSADQRQQEYVGTIYKCPNCGSTVNQTDIVCGSCGYRLSGKQAIGSARDFQQKLLSIEMTRKQRAPSFLNLPQQLDVTDKQVIALITSYPIPSSIEDIVEFFYMALGNIDVSVSKKSLFNNSDSDGRSRARAISNAWVGKMQQLYHKAELLFPGEPEFARIKEAYLAKMKELKLLK